MTMADKIMQVVKSTYNEMYPEEAESARERGQRIRRAEERVLAEKPSYAKLIAKLKSQGDIVRYGIPVGAEPVDNEEGYDEDEEVDDTPRSAKDIVFHHQTIGGDHSMGGKTKFRRWLEDVFIASHPDLKKKIDGVSGKTKRNMMRSISYVVRRSIAQNGIEPNATATFDDEDNTEDIHYNKSGRSWKSTYPKGGYK
tara:strand:- start:366 stop:956 length:591 start_codon:yes stop_codon:yes gene_type:complete